jgi:hypothetical protein
VEILFSVFFSESLIFILIWTEKITYYFLISEKAFSATTVYEQKLLVYGSYHLLFEFTFLIISIRKIFVSISLKCAVKPLKYKPLKFTVCYSQAHSDEFFITKSNKLLTLTFYLFAHFLDS